MTSKALQLGYLVFYLLALVLPAAGKAQERTGTLADTAGRPAGKMDHYLEAVTKKIFSVEEKIDRSFGKYLSKLLRQEGRLKKKIEKKDTTLAKELFNSIEEKYAAVKAAPRQPLKTALVYSGHLDSLATALGFLKDSYSARGSDLQKALARLSSLKKKLNETEAVKKFIAERHRLLKENLEKLGILSELKDFQKQAYYYEAQMRAYKAMWEEPTKLEKRVVDEVGKLPRFKEFFQKNSLLSSLFTMPGGGLPPFPNGGGVASLAGLQTRASIQASLIQRFGTGPDVRQTLLQNMQAARGQLTELKNKPGGLTEGNMGNSSADIDLSKGFTPNPQKTKTFLQRLEYGANIQSQKAGRYFPVTSDIGLSLGYKLNDKGSIGIGGSYKLGLGRGWNNIRMSSEGMGLRSYVDYKLKGSLYISGGYEQNYRTALEGVTITSPFRGGRMRFSAWQASGLLGLSKKYKVSKKLKGDVRLLWDFLSYQQVPRTQALLFRIGYRLK